MFHTYCIMLYEILELIHSIHVGFIANLITYTPTNMYSLFTFNNIYGKQ